MNGKSYNIEHFQALAIEKGGECLSKQYVRSRDELEWRCEKGHVFKLAPRVIFNKNFWCPDADCTPRKKRYHTIESLKAFAISRGWELLSDKYLGGNVKHNLKCENGHLFKMTPEHLLKKIGCRICSDNALLTIDLFKRIALDKEGECLSEKYEGQKEKLKFRCKEGHIFDATPTSIKNRGSWCLICSGKEKGTIKEMQEVAKSKGGKCLSLLYVDSKTKLEWQCKDEHKWLAIPRDVKHKSWCPACRNKQEAKCKYIFEKLLKTEFNKTRKIIEGRLELDGYSEKYKLAFEYNGEQHYIKDRFFNRTDERFEAVKNRDKKKKEECEQKGVALIVIPFNRGNTDIELIEFIKTELSNINIPFENINQEILMHDFYQNHSVLKEIEKLVESKNGKLLSKEYSDIETKLAIICNKHQIQWETKYHKLKNNNWCPDCGGTKRRTIEEMQKIAKDRKGECLSLVYINNRTPLLWKCDNGHQWPAKPDNIKQGTWCPECWAERKKN